MKKQGKKKKNCNQYPPETPAKITNFKKCNRQTKKIAYMYFNRIYGIYYEQKNKRG